MKTILLTALVILLVANLLHAQEKIRQKNIIRSGVIIKSTPIPFLFETGVGGTLEITQESLLFVPNPCSEIEKKYSYIFPCNSHLINNIILNFSDISKIKRRNYLLLFPNRLVIRKLDGETYLFFTYRRKRVINAYKRYKAENPSIDMK